MKVLIAVHHFPPRYTGGAEWRAFRTASALSARGHTVKVVAVERIDEGPSEGAAWEDGEYEGVSIRRLSYDIKAVPDPWTYEFDNPWIGDQLRKLFSEFQPDLFHLIGGYLISGRSLHEARSAGIPSVVTLTDFWFLCRRISMIRSDGSISTLPIDPQTCARCLAEEQRRYRLPARVLPGLMEHFWQNQTGRAGLVEARLDFLRQALSKANVIISPSMFLKSVCENAGFGAEKIVFSRQGRDFPGLTPELLEKTAADHLRVGYIGQIAWLKGVHVLFEAASNLKDLPLTVKAYGDPDHFASYASGLRRQAASDPRLELAGTYPQEALSLVFKDIDVLVVPSLWYENSPNVILEAFAHHTPIVASNLGGMAELVIHEKNGLLFEPGSASSLSLQLRRLAEDPSLLRELREGIGPVRTAAEEIDELEAIYQQVVQQAVEKEPVLP